MGNIGKNRIVSQVSFYVNLGRNKKGLFFKDVFNEPQFSELFQTTLCSHFRDRVFNPLVTLLAFLQQTLSVDRSCRNAVAYVNAERIHAGLPPASSDTGAYCRARKRIPIQLMQKLLTLIGSTMEKEVPKEWLWKGRHVKLVDGSSASVADTKANRREFKGQTLQKNVQARFPKIRFVSLFSLTTGCVLDVATSSFLGKGTGETTQLLKLQHSLDPGDVLIGDALYSVYHLFALLMKRRVDFVMKVPINHIPNVIHIRRFSKKEWLVVLSKPEPTSWMSDDHYHQISEELTLRVCQVTAHKKGFRSKNLTLITSLLDQKFASAQDLADLYGQRWHAELNLRCIKDTLQMHFINGKTPDMVRKELLATLITYNLICRLMGIAALEHALTPNQISFKATVQILGRYAPLWQYSSLNPKEIFPFLTEAIARQKVGNRPGRWEPRLVKYNKAQKYIPIQQKTYWKSALKRRRPA